MRCQGIRLGLVTSLAIIALTLASPRNAFGQAATIENTLSLSTPGSGISLLGRAPGSNAFQSELSPGGGNQILSTSPGPFGPRVPTSISTPGGGAQVIPSQGITMPVPLPLTNIPIYGTLALPEAGENEGSSNGLSLDTAIEVVIRENLVLRSKYFEIPQAEADILTASLRANPLLYADAQLVPYGQYSKARPGGQTQYDVNISHPIDVSHKRTSRMLVARRAKNVLESLYHDAVRMTIDNLYIAYVDVLAARETVRYAEASVQGLSRILTITETLKKRGTNTSADVERIRVDRLSAELGLADAEERLNSAKVTLATVLNLPLEQPVSLELLGSIHDRAARPPPRDELVRMALVNRPDINSYRLGIQRASADVKLAYANRYADIYLLAQPYTFQSNAPQGLKSSTSWALGMTVPLPVYNRNQGNIARAKLNVTQTQIELAARERQIVTEVALAEREYTVTRAAIERLEKELLPAAKQMLDDSEQLYIGGEQNLVVFLTVQRDYNDRVKQYRDTLVRHRRSMLNLNTTVGQRVLP